MKHSKRARWLGCLLALVGMVGGGTAAAADEQGALAAEEGRLVIYAATDLNAVRALIDDFERAHPGVRVDYHDMQTSELNARFLEERRHGGGPDVMWSSAMDLQMKLVNDGHALPYRSAVTEALPPWAVWKDEAFGTTLEPIVFVYNRAWFGDQAPQSHAELLRLLERGDPALNGRLVTYDPERSGLGFLLQTQDVQANPTVFWRLAEAMGRNRVRTEPTTSVMLDRIAAGEAVLGYNMLGSYALRRARQDDSLGIVQPKDYTLVLSRVAFISKGARHPNAARLWLDHMLSARGQRILAGDGLVGEREALGPAFRPLALGAGLIAYLDQYKYRQFIAQWRAAIGRASDVIE
ncbi:ABC transporter substrate-binding protein [Nitrogeniibacter aestuarii]|uniref:ABC transporter substrate-binding protein n=1 Tax=Nitrogeniibacter aestuarii TaxID=2815343 RepID=UPI001E386B73|nr:ABC transporter substrate-binding protein [Nitrogeniibacter aestuarii]